MDAVLSIIIPAYNVAGYLEKCLDSILAQTFQEYEVILVDDGSTDDTPVICDTYAQKDSRIGVTHKKNEGVSIARNTGIDIAKGEYILFFDGDDFVEPYTCEELYKLIKEKQADTIIYGYHRYKQGKITETSLPIFPQGIYEGRTILNELVPRFIGLSYASVNRWLCHEEKALYVENPALWHVMVSSSIIKENQIKFNKNLKVGEDTIFISEYLSHASKCYVYHKCYYYLVTRETSTIYTYEKNPIAKLDGKMKLLDARKELTERILMRTKVNIDNYWRGTVLMSVLEIAFLLSKKHPEYNFLKRYKLFLSYAKHPEVLKTINGFKLEIKPRMVIIPFLLLKSHLSFILFLCTTVLQLINYEFVRN